ncbi:MAG: MarR family transcriptional regulator, partial [Sphingomonadales bacterium]|nr:MarR family transcriptional regulator [Sphingomonadales bacterium]
MTQVAFIWDVCAAKHGGDRQSVAANPSRVAKRMMHVAVLGVLATGDFTAAEIAAKLGRPLHTISGRVSELRALG